MAKLREEIWMDLAKLFFESPVPKSDREVEAVAAALKLSGWSRVKTQTVLLSIVAPNAKRNIGYGLPVVIGEEIDLLERRVLIPKMQRSAQVRAAHPRRYYFLFQDWLNGRVLQRVRADRLLSLLQG